VPGEQELPKYQQIAADLRAAIVGGDYAPGARLPGENTLMSEYGVARMTARQALAALIGEGLAVSRKGSGVFVREFRQIIRDGVSRLASEKWGQGTSIWSNDSQNRVLKVDQVTIDEVKPPAHAKTALDLNDDETVICRSRRFVLDGKPVLLASSYLPSSIARGTRIAEKDTGPGGIYARLGEMGYKPVHFQEDLRARMPLLPEVDQLKLDSATPVVDIVRVAYTEDGQPVEINEMIADSSAYIFRYRFDS
jgi:GntR family transcriptional regulator